MTLTEKIFTTLSDPDDRASVDQFMALLRRVPGLRQWFRAVTLDTMARQKLDAFLDGKLTPPLNLSNGRRLLRWLAGMTGDARYEIEKLKWHGINPVIYGGLSRVEIVALIRRYQAGTIDCATFLVMHSLRRDLVDGAEARPATVNAVMSVMRAAIVGEEPQLIHQLARAADFFHGQKIGTITSLHFGYSAWWKLNVLGYMFHNPKPAYRISEFHQCLIAQKLHVDLSDIRRFCRLHKIARNMRPGRPRKLTRAAGQPVGK
jgi:hypothetical protein